MKKFEVVQLVITSKNIGLARELLMQADCSHAFKKHGLGFKCQKCEYYTGLNHTLNKLITDGKYFIK